MSFCANHRWRRFFWLPLVAASLTLVGCATRGERSERTPATESALYLDAVRGLIGQGQYYAAIAHIQEDRRLHGDTAELRLLEADARRNLRQNKTAEALYQGVLRGASQGPLAGKARHGLALLYAGINLDASLREFREAARLKPTDATIRSDYGFALMQARRFDEAQVELFTAAELEPEHIAARNNLLILFYVQGNETRARWLAAQTQVDAALLARLKAQAQSFNATPAAPTRTGK